MYMCTLYVYRCHCYAPPTTPPPSRHQSLMSLSSAGSKSPPLSAKRPGSGRGSITRPSSASSTASVRPSSANKVSVSFLPPTNFPLGNEDAELVWAELERARDTLADIQALCLEENAGDEGSEVEGGSGSSTSEDYMTSVQWLEVHGLRTNKLMYQDLIGSLAFKHCKGRVQLPRPSNATPTGSVEMVNACTLNFTPIILNSFNLYYADTPQQDCACSILQGVCPYQV